MLPERHHLKENESLESAIYTQVTLNRRHSASAKSFEYQPDFESSINKLRGTSPYTRRDISKPRDRIKSGNTEGRLPFYSLNL